METTPSREVLPVPRSASRHTAVHAVLGDVVACKGARRLEFKITQKSGRRSHIKHFLQRAERINDLKKTLMASHRNAGVDSPRYHKRNDQGEPATEMIGGHCL